MDSRLDLSCAVALGGVLFLPGSMAAAQPMPYAAPQSRRCRRDDVGRAGAAGAGRTGGGKGVGQFTRTEIDGRMAAGRDGLRHMSGERR